jgi:hypothetical protein
MKNPRTEEARFQAPAKENDACHSHSVKRRCSEEDFVFCGLQAPTSEMHHTQAVWRPDIDVITQEQSWNIQQDGVSSHGRALVHHDGNWDLARFSLYGARLYSIRC